MPEVRLQASQLLTYLGKHIARGRVGRRNGQASRQRVSEYAVKLSLDRSIESFLIGSDGTHDELARLHSWNHRTSARCRRSDRGVLIFVEPHVALYPARPEVDPPRGGSRMARVENDEHVVGAQLRKDHIELIVDDIGHPGCAPVVGHERLVEAVILVAVQVLHLGSVPREVKDHRIVGSGLAHELPKRAQYPGARRGVLGQRDYVLGRKSPPRDQDLLHSRDVIERAEQVRHGLVVVDADEERALYSLADGRRRNGRIACLSVGCRDAQQVPRQEQKAERRPHSQGLA